MNKIKLVEAAQLRNDLPDFRVGDTITVFVKVIEGDKERVQQYKGIVMGIKGSGLSKTFRVRKISNGVGVERIFPISSPFIEKIEVNKNTRAEHPRFPRRWPVFIIDTCFPAKYI